MRSGFRPLGSAFLVAASAAAREASCAERELVA